MGKGRTALPDKVHEQRPAGDPPAAPSFLSPEARQEWDRIVPDLFRRSMMTAADVDAIATYCETYSQYIQLATLLQTYGLIGVNSKGAMAAHPAFNMQDKLIKHIRGFCADFGLTPSSRGRMDIKPAPTGDDDEFHAFLNGDDE